ncbi:MAG: hypothetical protein COV45_03690 [Deltaproteobacteria bacterium CG11_big_fil_rev_8_21_14_0_20_47_16]|nr:MAG: hypothetical protein COV45_03690 [Deltaproteobacteria bacterium CG11_big_fil_rev_8_21_14_0_20_47_16]
MKRQVMILGLMVVLVGMALPAMAHAAIEGIASEAECPNLKPDQVGKIFEVLRSTPITDSNFQSNFQQDKKRFVFCLGTTDAEKDKEYPKLKTQTLITNASQYPVIIYGLTIDGVAKDDAQNYLASTGAKMLTVMGGKVLLQNFHANNLRGPIMLMGNNVGMNDAHISCYLDKGMKQNDFYPKTALTAAASDSTFLKVTIANCNEAANIYGSDNVAKGFTVTFDKTQSPFDMNGGKGIILADSTLSAITDAEGGVVQSNKIEGYDDALILMNHSSASFVNTNGPIDMSYVNPDPNVAPVFADIPKLMSSTVVGTVYVKGSAMIQKNTLDGNPAVMIMQGASPVGVTQNNFKSANTIVYTDSNESKQRQLFSTEWMGKHKPSEDATAADYIIGKLMDQANTSNKVELNLLEASSDKKEGQVDAVDESRLNYKLNCDVLVADDDIPLRSVSAEGVESTKKILKGEKFFKCDGGENGFPWPRTLRVLSNRPTVSLMSDAIQVAQMADMTSEGKVTIAASQPVSLPLGGDLGDTGFGGGNDSNLPSIPSVDEPSIGEGSGGSNMTGSFISMGSDGAPSAASGASGCGAMMMWGAPSLPMQALPLMLTLLTLVPIVVRRSVK